MRMGLADGCFDSSEFPQQQEEEPYFRGRHTYLPSSRRMRSHRSRMGLSDGIRYFRAEASKVTRKRYLPVRAPCDADFTISSSTVFLVFAGSWFSSVASGPAISLIYCRYSLPLLKNGHRHLQRVDADVLKRRLLEDELKLALSAREKIPPGAAASGSGGPW